MDYYTIGQKIRKIRRAHGLSQEELAEKIGISTTHMSHIETANTKLSLPVFVKIASALETSADEFLSDQPASERNTSYDKIFQLLDTCTSQQVKLIYDIIKASKIAMDKYL